MEGIGEGILNYNKNKIFNTDSVSLVLLHYSVTLSVIYSVNLLKLLIFIKILKYFKNIQDITDLSQ